MASLLKRSGNIQSVLNRLYPNPPVPLNSVNDFTFLISVLLSAQTTDGKVNEVTRELFRVANTPDLMAKLDQNEVQRIIQPVGLAPTKAKNIVALSKLLLEKFDGKVPCTYEDLESLPGVGHKTASVVMSTVFKEAAIPVDTHIHRLALRWGLSKDEKSPDNVQKDLMAIFPKDDWNKLHLQLIYFGREYCTAKDHTPSECPICSWVKSDRAPPVDKLGQFVPKKKAKGIVYYNDRIEELVASPSLTPYESPSKIVSSKVVIVESLDINVDIEGDIVNDTKGATGKKKRVAKNIESKKSSSASDHKTVGDVITDTKGATGKKKRVAKNIEIKKSSSGSDHKTVGKKMKLK